MDLKKTDKHGNVLNLTPKAKRSQADYYSFWKENPGALEPTPEDIKCELQLLLNHTPKSSSKSNF